MSVEFQTGDLILFSGKSIVDDIIEFGGHSVYSHCGIILKDPIYIDPKLSGTYFIESGFSTDKDVETNKRIEFGVMLHDLELVLKERRNEGSKMWLRKLDNFNLTEEIKAKISSAYRKVCSIPYDINPFDWLRVTEASDYNSIKEFMQAFNYAPSELQSIKALWCSSFAAYFYVEIGVLSRATPWDVITPRDFGEDNMEYINGHRLGQLEAF